MGEVHRRVAMIAYAVFVLGLALLVTLIQLAIDPGSLGL